MRGVSVEILILILWLGLIVFVTMIALIKHYIQYSERIRFVKTEMKRAYDESEYLHYKHELTALRWSIIPGITPQRAIRISRYLKRKIRKARNSRH